jgi:hypothetical protein
MELRHTHSSLKCVEEEQANLQVEMNPLSTKIRSTHMIKEKLKPSVNTAKVFNKTWKKTKNKSLNILNRKPHITHHSQ